ncbi:hypothetical protein [uncultured Thiocystis sp.]|jgi:hypothetical protein|uniref:hypothetical protein n=1 Tax=uncultured Thiocystis sp. TaxID=1202134 RepID=UPI0025F19182|nr:hypothetical protein [uncultured Thiocystis sp.]
MQVQRQFFEVTSRQLVIDLPESFVNHRVEAIVLTVDDGEPLATVARRRPHPAISGKGKTMGDIVSPIFDEGDALAEIGKDVRALIADSEPVALGEFRLNLTGFQFNRDEANAR